MTREEVLVACRRSMDDSGYTFFDDGDIASIADVMLRGAERFTPGVLVRPYSAGDDRWTFSPV